MKINHSNRIYLSFAEKNKLGMHTDLDDLLDKIDGRQLRSSQQLDIEFESTQLNQTLTDIEKQSILRLILRREQMIERYLRSSKGK